MSQPPADFELIAANVARLREQIATAAISSGRSPESVRLIAVTKYAPLDALQAVIAAGCLDLAESRPQDLWQRAEALRELPVQWHFIGHLQRNKIARTLPLISLLHSVDSERLLTAVNAAAIEAGRVMPVLLEVNISGEAAKHGFQPAELEPLLSQLSGLSNVRVQGLMGMAGLTGGSDHARREFDSLFQLRERLRKNCPPQIQFEELSMGMSGDFIEAIAAGATLVRIGSALFE